MTANLDANASGAAAPDDSRNKKRAAFLSVGIAAAIELLTQTLAYFSLVNIPDGSLALAFCFVAILSLPIAVVLKRLNRATILRGAAVLSFASFSIVSILHALLFLYHIGLALVAALVLANLHMLEHNYRHARWLNARVKVSSDDVWGSSRFHKFFMLCQAESSKEGKE